jgi:hypothetical protein
VSARKHLTSVTVEIFLLFLRLLELNGGQNRESIPPFKRLEIRMCLLFPCLNDENDAKSNENMK